MKKLIGIFLSLAVLFLVFEMFINSKVEDYDKEWSRVKDNIDQGLPKSALKIVDNIYTTAKDEGNSPQLIKSLIYRISLQSRFQENHILTSIAYFEKELLEDNEVVNQILHSLLAQLYEAYYSQNQWEINDRATLVNYNNSDINTWDALSFSKKITNHYLQSLKNETQLKQIKLSDYSLILDRKEASNFVLYPSLFDLLANRAIRYFSEVNHNFDDIQPLKSVDFSNGLLSTNDFLKLSLANDTIKDKDQIVLELFNKLLQLHQDNDNIDALVDLEIRRLDYYRYKADNLEDKDEIYLQSLFDLKKQYSKDPVSVRVSYKIALVYESYGDKYDRLKGEKYRWHKSKAVDMCEEAIGMFPNAEYANSCLKIIERIQKQHFQFTLHEAELKDEPFLGSLRFKNVSKLFFRIINIKTDDFLQISYDLSLPERREKILDQTPLRTWEVNLPDSKDFQEHSTEFKVDALNQGYYVIVASSDSTFKQKNEVYYQSVFISNLSYIVKYSEIDGKASMYVLNRKSGKGLSDVNIDVSIREYDNTKRDYVYRGISKDISTKDGYVKIDNYEGKNHGNYVFRLEKDRDILYSAEYLNFSKNREHKSIIKSWIFTDRAIYRPGQTVYFKVLITENTANDYTLKKDYGLEMEFKDANNKKVVKHSYVSGEYGSFNGEFVIPQGLLNGTFTIKSLYGSKTFNVEEYKRPTFRVEFDSLKDQIKIGDFVELKGVVEDYSGGKVENSEVKYRVVMNTFSPYYRYGSFNNFYPSRSIDVANGIVKTDDNGIFTLGFTSSNETSDLTNKYLSYHFTIFADATDITGETQSASMSLTLNNSYINLGINAQDLINTENTTGIKISATNSVGVGLETDIEVNLYKLVNSNIPFLSRDWSQPDLFLLSKDEFKRVFPKHIYMDEDNKENLERQLLLSKTIRVNGNDNVLSDNLKSLKAGEYVVKLKAVDKKGESIEIEKYITLYSSVSSTLSNNKVLSVMVDKSTAKVGDNIILSISSSDKKTRVLYEINNGDILIDRQWINLSRSQKNIQIPVMEDYRGDFSIKVMAIRDNRFYSQTKTIKVPFENKKLNLKLETFRDYLSPGAEEEWKLVISGPNGEKATAEILASMYDASLDKFMSNNWEMSLYNSKRQNNRWGSSLFGTNTSRVDRWIHMEDYDIPKKSYPEIDWFGYEFYGRSGIMFAQDMAMKSSRVEEVVMESEPSSAATSDEEDEIANEEIEEVIEEENNNAMPLRTNFSETAFFYPDLKTDAEGNTIISFKTPDALTEWKFMALAHTKDLKTGHLVENIKARKELMVLPNVPRFVRQGDEINFTTKIVNFTENDIVTDVSIEFFDGISLKTVALVNSDSEQSLSIGANSNGKLSWQLKIPYDVQMLSYRIKASTENFTDGEERSFPVLTNRILVTETMPMFLNPNEKKTYNFSSLVDKTEKSNSIRNYKYTVELTSNPVWYAIQALPYLSENKNRSTLSTFNKYYSNTVSSFIVNSNPKIKKVFENWKQYSPDSFLSNLQKNTELKNAVLEATPWVLESEDETEQKRRIGVLFDINRLSLEKNLTLEKLNASQLQSGAWPWFDGMRADKYSTQKIVLGFAKLHDKNIIHLNDDRVRARIVKRAVNYLDEELVAAYTKLKKLHPESMRNNNLNSSEIQYLYLRALLISEYPIKAKHQEAFNYYTLQAKKFWLNKNEYLQAMIAISINRLGYRNEAEAIVRSLKERALHSDEMGTYWRQERGWNWYQAPVETQSMLIELFSEIDKEDKIIDQMKVWLLKQKQTQRWKTPSATLEAVFALLTTGKSLINESQDVIMTVGGETITDNDEHAKEAGTGYLKVNWHGEEINKNLAKIELNNPKNSIAWAAAYWQYFEDMDKVESSESPLSIEKKFFVESFSEKGTQISPLEDGQKLETGQKLISRIIIRTDRNMDFVHLKDMRSSALEPISNISGYKYSSGLGYYENITDVSTDFFFRSLQKGTYVLEYAVFVSQSGSFSNGIATIQSMYAPEFSAHSEGIRLIVE